MKKCNINSLDKNKFYEQLKRFNNRNIPIFIQMPINNESKYSIILDEYRNTVEKTMKHQYTLQIIDRTLSGFEKYVCKDINFSLVEESIKSDYQLYKFINDKIATTLKNKKHN